MTPQKKKAVYTETHDKRTALHPRRHKAVKDVMTARVVAVTSVTFLPEAALIMKEEDIGALPVVTEDGTLLGILTDRDIAIRAVATGHDTKKTRVQDIFTTEELVTVTPDTDMSEAEDLMAEHQVRRLPVVERGNRLVGMVALGDIARETVRDGGKVIHDVSQPGGEHSD